MSVCNNCRTPGSCCSRFELNFLVDSNDWYEESLYKLKVNNLPFIFPVAKSLRSDNGVSTRVLFSCTKLSANGKCLMYNDRPYLCREYVPQSDDLCAEYVPTLKGIPIVQIGERIK